jgi:uncharacterized membrane protein
MMNSLKQNFWVKHREFLSLPVAFIIWYYVPYLTSWIDPEAGQYDVSWIEGAVIATLLLLAGLAFIWFILRFFYPGIYRVFDDYLERNEKITSWQKGQFSLYFFLGCLLAWAILVLAVI